MSSNTFERGRVNRIRLHVMPTTRFKTFAITLYAGIPLEENQVTSTALLPFVFRRGTSTTPETIALRERLDDLYGAGFGFDVFKRGNNQFIQFRMDVINDAFVESKESLLAASLRYLGEVVSEPLLESGHFATKYVQSERDTLRKRLEAIINDKIRYASERCTEVMCEGDPYRLHALGNRADLPNISAESLYERYHQWINEAVFDLYIAGDTSLAEVETLVAEAFKLPDGDIGAFASTDVRSDAREVKTVVEKMDVKQGKLNLGLRTGISYGDDQYPALLVYNGVLGAYPHSKLFINVREKASLAYYASSRIDGHKGLLTIQSGIEIDKYERALTIIKEQIADIQAGKISELEIDQTKAMLVNSVREMQDSAAELIAYDFNAQFSGSTRTAEAFIAQIQAVTADDIVQIANGIHLDTVYFLRDRKEA
ncbi:putative Zn-dependent peptidase [Paenibacillus cellulosilyticus]|uniref:Putative Zn-dependent peptidase n=1 Tax=Paenibacillus cellulosilyticus TaxID=375489 RepID=A0A2V2Z1G6_9BACL|nr:pitrilysin family protein [Paenibacillus cellulosilyticus]PWW06459.1 putative Zn-dependent peptidase [Paenibacillus cellulosilyticus]QKS46196.1 insulinase family protein [Paenibacillus cellulosilyticus]